MIPIWPVISKVMSWYLDAMLMGYIYSNRLVVRWVLVSMQRLNDSFLEEKVQREIFFARLGI
jgi:hypothetical protein